MWGGVDKLTRAESVALFSGGPCHLRPGAERMIGALLLDLAVRCILDGDDDEFTRIHAEELGIEEHDDDEAIIRRALEHARTDLGLTPPELVELRKWIEHKPGASSAEVLQ